ncbi:peptide ABC transporter substrate-binding protein [Bosea vaviloviae]|uniref:ABC transporter substrate-binding protein n=1 Tax=Bosea vaviloviae TaxID=1526658 RepID=A0A1D7TYP2_9HYPH|nr:peptide ABC transporter substrate-binding protein [Bosea vaviloviae]AOO80220.1 ABC transporter substrate-binding protein [Bosea vaviloviae]
MADESGIGPQAGAMAVSRRALLFGASVLAALPWGAGSQAQPAPKPTKPPSAPKGQAVIGYSQEITVLHPLMPANEVDQGVWWNLFSPLWALDQAGKFVPVLAKEVPTVANGGISADGLVWKVTLREGVKWHDGRDFSAEDVRFTFDLIRNPQFRTRSRSGFSLLEDVKTEGDTISWRMKEPFAPFLSFLAWTFIVPRHLLDGAADPNATPFQANPVGTGPFKFVERKTGSHVLLAANTAYFGEGPYLERLVFRYVPDLNAMFTQFRTGEIDYIGLQGIPPHHYAEAKTLKNVAVHLCPRASVENLTLNLAHPALKEKVVRQALYLGLDKNAIIEALYYGLPLPASSFMPPQNWAFNDALPRHVHDPAKARAILDAAGWKPGPDGVRVKDGVRLAFTNSTTTGNPTREQAQQLLVQDWAKIGAEMTIKNMPAAVLWAKFWAESQFDSLMTNTTYTVASDPDVMHRFGGKSIPLKAGTGSNVSQYENPKVDSLLAKGIAVTDIAQRAETYREAQALILDDLPMLPIFQSVQVEGTKAGLVGFANNVNALSNAWNAGSWYWA